MYSMYNSMYNAMIVIQWLPSQLRRTSGAYIDHPYRLMHNFLFDCPFYYMAVLCAILLNKVN